MTTTAQIAAKGCQNTGITEDVAKRLHDNLGRTILAVVELTADARTENRDGDEKVKLSIGMIEVVPDGDASEHIRELARLFHYERQVASGQPTLDDGSGNEPTVEKVIAAGAAQRPHPFLPVDAADDNGICDVCGLVETAPRHSTQDTLPDDDEGDGDETDDLEDDDDTTVDEGEDSDDGDEADDWEYDQPDPRPSTDPFATS